jgi:hypothetical protein
MLTPSEALSLALNYNEQCTTPLSQGTKTYLLEQITDRIGSLSKPSKMPGRGWSISANHCITGAKLAKIEGTPCSVCYAMKGHYRMHNVQSAMEKRLAAWREDPDWVMLQAMRLVLLREEYFRWFDSGDLQSAKMLEDICCVARLAPFTKFWLPTRERRFVADVSEVPENLVIRLSDNVMGDRHSVTSALSSSVSAQPSETEWNCPALQQGNSCGECRACWDSTVRHVVYHEH